MKELVLLLCAGGAFLAANVAPTLDQVTGTSSLGSQQFRGGGSACLAGCNENDYCIDNDRKKVFNPHYECRFTWMPTTCYNTLGEVWCNKIYSTCANPVDLLETTTSGKCAEGTPPREQG